MDSWARVRRNYHLGTTSIDQEVAITKLATKLESIDSSLVKSPMMHSSPLIKPDSIARPPPDGMWWYYAPIFLCGPYPRKIYGEDILVYELFPGWAAVKTTTLYIWPRTRIRVQSAANLARLYRRLVSPNSLTPVRDTCRIRTIYRGIPKNLDHRRRWGRKCRRLFGLMLTQKREELELLGDPSTNPWNGRLSGRSWDRCIGSKPLRLKEITLAVSWCSQVCRHVGSPLTGNVQLSGLRSASLSSMCYGHQIMFP